MAIRSPGPGGPRALRDWIDNDAVPEVNVLDEAVVGRGEPPPPVTLEARQEADGKRALREIDLQGLRGPQAKAAAEREVAEEEAERGGLTARVAQQEARAQRAAAPAEVAEPVSEPPVITNPGSKSYTQGVAISPFEIAVSDPDSSFTVALTGLPAGLTYDTSTHRVSGTVARTAAVQAYTVTITADDGTTTVTDTFRVTIAAYVNLPPVITRVSGKLYVRGETISPFSIFVRDPNDDALTVGVTGLPSGLSYSTSTGQVSGTVSSTAAAQSYTVTISASDGSLNVSSTFAITVRIPVNRPPVVTNPGTQRWTRGVAIAPFTIQTSDPEGHDVRFVEGTGLPSGITVSSSGTVSGTPTDQAGLYRPRLAFADVRLDGRLSSNRVRIVFSVWLVNPAPPPPPIQAFRSCAAMRSAGWTRGVRRAGGTYRTEWNAAEMQTYALNTGRDADGDGSACE